MYLMHRISHEYKEAKKLLDEGFLSIGWSSIVKKGKGELFIDLANETFVEGKEKFVQKFVKFGKEFEMDYFKSRRAYLLLNFLTLNEGDIVLIPIQKAVTIVKVIEKPKVFTDCVEADIGFVSKIEILYKNISRSDFLPPEITSKLKYRGTNLILKNENTINEVIDRFNSGEKIHYLNDTKSKMINEVYKYITKNISHVQFEFLIKSVFEHLGAEADVVSNSPKVKGNDHEADVDVIATFENIKVIIYVQAKQHTNESDNRGIVQLIKYKHMNNQQYSEYSPVKWLINTGTISDKDIQQAYDENIRVMQEKEFAEMIVDIGLQCIPKFGL